MFDNILIDAPSGAMALVAGNVEADRVVNLIPDRVLAVVLKHIEGRLTISIEVRVHAGFRLSPVSARVLAQGRPNSHQLPAQLTLIRATGAEKAQEN